MNFKFNKVKSLIYSTFFGFIILTVIPFICTGANDEKSMIKDADVFFGQEDYLKALPLYVKLYEQNPKKNIYGYRAGICYLYKSDEKQKSIEYLEKILKNAPKTEDINFYLGRAYHINERFEDAITYLQNFLSKKCSQEKKIMAEILIENCKNAKTLVENPLVVSIQNLGVPINTNYSEYGPVISADESVLIFTYKGERSTGGQIDYDGNPSIFGDYYEDIFISYKVGGKWMTPESIGENINTKGHDASIAVSGDGQKLFIFKSSVDDGGDIYMSTLDGDVWSTPEKLKGDVNTQYWEGSVSMSSDGKTLYFSSEKPGGMGKRDIYKAKLQSDGSWRDVQNLGPTINTNLDDDAPFIHPDGKMLHFSSKGHKSMGGYDIFRCEMLTDSIWSEPYNLGYPINTTEDDIYYVLSADGKRGYYSSGKAGEFGQQDIYVVDPGFIGKKIALAMVTGIITLNDKSAKADIHVADIGNNKSIGNYSSNTATGKYLINLSTGNNYQLIFKVEGVDEQSRNVNTMNVDSFMNAVVSVQFYTKDFLEKQKQDSISKIQADSAAMLKSGIKKSKKDSVHGEFDLSYEEILEKYGNYSLDGLEFKVQIAAFEMAQNYNYGPLSKLGNIEKQKYQDGITRFTIGGSFKTLNEADALLKSVRVAGVNDAFILCFYKGQRIPIKNLFSVSK